MSRVTLHQRSFRAMGTTMELLLEAPGERAAEAALGAAEAEIRQLEALLSRFRPVSELSLLNRARSLRVGPDLLRVLTRALAMRHRTGGLFDPTLAAEAAAIGDDRDLTAVAPEGGAAAATGWRGPALTDPPVRIDRDRSRVWLAPGTDIDLGAIAKGDAADQACRLLSRVGPALVSAGGDLTVSGPRAGGEPWSIAIDTGGEDLVLLLGEGAIATSGVDRRRWHRGGADRHHILDPGTGDSAATDLVRATAIAGSGAEADAFATALMVAGAGRAAALAGEWGIAAVLVAADGAVTLCGGLA